MKRRRGEAELTECDWKNNGNLIYMDKKVKKQEVIAKEKRGLRKLGSDEKMDGSERAN